MTQTVPTQLPTEWRDFFALTKPRVMSLVIFTGLCGLLAAPGHINPILGFTGRFPQAACPAPMRAISAY